MLDRAACAALLPGWPRFPKRKHVIAILPSRANSRHTNSPKCCARTGGSVEGRGRHCSLTAQSSSQPTSSKTPAKRLKLLA